MTSKGSASSLHPSSTNAVIGGLTGTGISPSGGNNSAASPSNNGGQAAGNASGNNGIALDMGNANLLAMDAQSTNAILNSLNHVGGANVPVGTPISSNPFIQVGRRDSISSIPLDIRQANMDDDDSDGDDDGTPRTSEKRAGRRKIKIEYIEDKSRRHITFSKRKAGIMKKAYELSTLTGTQVLLLVASETGHVYTFATPKLQPLITKPEGKNLIQACLNAPDMPGIGDYQQQGHQQSSVYDQSGEEKEAVYDDRQSVVGHGGVPVNYAAAMAGLASYQYAQSPNQSSAAAAAAANAAAQAYMNPAHYPAFAAAQYNAAMAAGYWPGSGQAVDRSGANNGQQHYSADQTQP